MNGDDGTTQEPQEETCHPEVSKGGRAWRGLPLSRVLDVLAVLVVLFVAYRIFIAPRYLGTANAHPAPHVTYQTLSGNQFVLTEQRGRVVFLDFWASWCEPCKLSLPLVEKFARAHPEVEVVAVDVGEPRAVVHQFAKTHGMRNVALDPQALSRGFFQIEGFPTMVVVDPQGRIRATWTGFNPAIQMNMAHAAQALRSS
ncbi:MAG TPA: TlpA disulfide reductase family protein [Candidatus Baltobacteraceae bacterium]|nr:TlpA disulfide reductase family protein [Candidatus Baltobacteraceae bacterium]